MDIVDMFSTKMLVFRLTIEKCKRVIQRPDLGLVVDLEASRPTYWWFWEAEAPSKKGSCIWYMSVGSHFPFDHVCVPEVPEIVMNVQ